jgi:hypothetical protein
MRTCRFAIILVFISQLCSAQETAAPQGENTDIDAEITNAKLRAESGSKSQWSIKANIGYNGGNLERPFGEVRPNYAGISSQDNSTSITGTIAAAYRWGKADTFRTGTGILVLTPFHNPKKADVSNPYLEYSRAMKIGKYQNIFDVSYTQFTQSAYKDAGYIGYVDVNHTAIIKIDPTEWEVGMVFDVNYTFFSDGKNAGDTLQNPESGRSDYAVGIFPIAEYAFSERYSFRTVFRFLTYDHYRNDSPTSFYRELYTQSVGLGIAITRDVYLYPNIQFAPEHLTPDLTNVGLNTTINIF